MTDAAILYRSHVEAIRTLPYEERLKAYDALIDYCLEDAEAEEGIAAALLVMAKPILDKWKSKREAARKGGEANGKQTESTEEANEKQTESKREANRKQTRSKPKANEKQTESKREAKVKVKEKVKDKNKEKDKRESGFTPPSVEEVREYCQKMGYKFDPETFVAFYASKGWLVGNARMKDWKSACTTWSKRREFSGKPPDKKIEQHDYDFEGIDYALLMKQHRG